MEHSGEYASVIGLSIKEAEVKARLFNNRLRVMIEDGEHYICTCDYVPSRINVEVTNGIVTSIVKYG